MLRRLAVLLLAPAVLLPSAAASTGASRYLMPDLVTRTPGTIYLQVTKRGKRFVRFSNEVVNVGRGPLELRPRADDCDADGDVANDRTAYQRIYRDADRDGAFTRGVDAGFRTRRAGCSRYHPAHKHWHFDALAEYDLLPTAPLGPKRKVSSCVLDTRLRLPKAPGAPGRKVYGGCGRNSVGGISIGWGDLYGARVSGQELDVTALEDGVYCLVSRADPENRLAESNERNNTRTTRIVLRAETVARRPYRGCALRRSLASRGRPPPVGAAIPARAGPLAARLEATERGLAAAIDRWRASGAPRPPLDVTLYALYEQRISFVLTARPRLADNVLRRLSPQYARPLRSEVLARRELGRLSRPRPLLAFRTGPAEPAAALRRYYLEAQRRFHVRWNVLAAVNYVESAFNKLRNASTAGAQGPMQFIPSTWRAYGLGGDVHNPHDAILGAANYLDANGAPADYRRALYRYNPSGLYVDAVLRYARRIRADSRAYYVLYSRQVFVRTPRGLVRLTGPR